MTLRRPGPADVLALAGVVLLLFALAAAPGAARAVATAPGGGGADPSAAVLRLASQTSWVSAAAPDNVFDLQVAAQVPSSSQAVDLNVSVYGALETRSDFGRSLTPGYADYIIAQPIRARLSSFTPNALGAIDIAISVGRREGQLHLSASGVYPVAVELRQVGGPTLARFVTHLLYLAAPPTGPRLGVAWVVPVHAPPGDAMTTAGSVTGAQDRQLTALVDALAQHPAVPATIRPTPDTVAALESVDPATVNRLGQSLVGREVLADAWVPTSLPAMLTDGLNDEASLSLTRGGDALSAYLGKQVTGRTWIQDGPVDQNTLTFLRFAQFDRVLLPESDLDANPSPITATQPFQVAGSDHTLIRAAVADSALAAHFTDQPDPVLAAHQLLADLAQIYGDAPAIARGVVVAPPDWWVPSPAFLDAFLSGLQDSPVLHGQTIDSFFDAVAPATNRDGGPLVRQLVTDGGAISAAAAGLLPDAQRAAKRQLDSLATSLPVNTKVYPRLERLLLEAPSQDLSVAERQSRLDTLIAGIRAETGLVQLPSSRTITLTARKGQLPITVASGSDEAVRVLLQVQSDKLKIPGATATGVATFALTLHKGNNLMVLTVVARTSGAFPLRLMLLSPDGNLIISTSNFTIQSTALSGVGVFLSAGAGLFLVVWWGRHAWRARSARRPAAAAPAAVAT